MHFHIQKYLKLSLAARAVHLDTLLSARGYLTDFSVINSTYYSDQTTVWESMHESKSIYIFNVTHYVTLPSVCQNNINYSYSIVNRYCE